MAVFLQVTGEKFAYSRISHYCCSGTLRASSLAEIPYIETDRGGWREGGREGEREREREGGSGREEAQAHFYRK